MQDIHESLTASRYSGRRRHDEVLVDRSRYAETFRGNNVHHISSKHTLPTSSSAQDKHRHAALSPPLSRHYAHRRAALYIRAIAEEMTVQSFN